MIPKIIILSLFGFTNGSWCGSGGMEDTFAPKRHSAMWGVGVDSGASDFQ